MPKTSGGDRRSENFKIPPARKFESNESAPAVDAEPPAKPKPKLEIAADMGFNKNQVADFQKLADKAKEAHENWLRATTELSRLEEISGVAAKRWEVNRYHLDERSAFLAMQRIIAREVPDVSKDDE